MEMSLTTLLFQGIPEIIALVIFILAVNNDLKEWKKGVLVGIILGVFIFFIRKLPVSFGFHTLLGTSICFILLKIMFKLELFGLIKSLLIGTLLVCIGEEMSFVVFTSILNITPEELIENLILWILSGWINIIILFIISLLFYLKNKKKCKI